MAFNIVIGCPIYLREWCLPRWLSSVFNQGIEPSNIVLIFGLTDSEEDNTRQLLEKYGAKVKDFYIIDCNDLKAFKDRSPERFYPLVEIRNRILEKVREINPDWYFSWDSDILLPDTSLPKLIARDVDLCSPYVELVKGIPNCMDRMPNCDGFRRHKPLLEHYPKDSFYKVGASFACLLFKKGTYDIVYSWHQAGEDLGFALDAYEKGFEFYIDSTIEGVHLFNRDI